MYHAITLDGDENDSPLTDEEVDSMFNFLYEVHNHLATGPQQPVFWWRCYGIKLACA